MQGKVSEEPQIHTAQQDLCQIQPLSFCPPISYALLYIACSQFSPSISEGQSSVGVYCSLEVGLACVEGDGQRWNRVYGQGESRPMGQASNVM